MFRAIKLFLPPIIALTTSASCVTETEEFDDDEFRVIDGDPASSSVPQYAATVALHQRFGDQVSVSPFCSGTLISSDAVLTAAHCCDEATFGTKFNPMEPEDVAIYFGEGPAFSGNSVNGEFYAVSQVSAHPSYNRSSLANDICMMRLSVPNQTTPAIPHLPSSIGLTNADAGKLLDHVGFGYADLAKTLFGVKLHAQVPLAGLGCVVPGCPSGGNAGQFSYVQDGSPYTGPCNGDSGGPAFITRNSTVYVAGITSYGDAYCDLYGVSTNVSYYQSFIDDFVGEGGGGGGGGGGPTCGDGVCEAGESCDGRNGTSSCISDCPGKTSGKKSGQFCYVGGTCTGQGCP